MDIAALFAKAKDEGRVGVARKSKIVDVRPATPGEVIVTVIAGEGKETESPSAEAGDLVVRNRSRSTGDESYLVKASVFAERYEGPLGPVDAEGWRPYRPRGVDMEYFVIDAAEGRFTFTAPWGEPMVAQPGDALVRNPTDHREIYRVAAAAFDATYEIVCLPGRQG